MGAVPLQYHTPEQKEYLVRLVANHNPVTTSVERMLEEFPDAYSEYSITSYRKYLKSEEGQRLLDSEKEKISEEAKKHAFSDRGGRVAVLTEIGTRLLEKLRTFQKSEVGGKEFLSVSGELRSVFRDIKEEMAKFGDLGQGVDFFASLIQTMGNLKDETERLPDFILRTLEEDTPLLTPSPDDIS